MYNKKFLTISLIFALLAGVVIFYACDNDKVDGPADDGKKSAQKLCSSFNSAVKDAAKLACIAEYESRRQKYSGDDAKAFKDAFNLEIAACGSLPLQWYSAYLGTIAAKEMCDCFTKNPDNQTAQMECMMGLMFKYDGYFRSEETLGDPVFEDAFDVALYSCTDVPEWFICMWSPENCGGE